MTLLVLLAALQFQRLPLNEALTQNTVPTMLQARDGLMWFGTFEGVDVYDGYRFRHITSDPRDPGSLGGVDVVSLLEDRDGGMWIAGTFGGGSWLDRLDEKTGAIKHFPRQLFGSPNLPTSSNVGLYQAPDGMIWIGTNTGLHRYDPGSGALALQVEPRIDNVVQIAAAGDGRLWLGTAAGLVRYRPATRELEAFHHDAKDPRSLINDFVTSLLPASDGTLWVGTLKGLSHLGPNRFESFAHDPKNPRSLGGDNVRTLLQDHEGRVWIGTQPGGLSRYLGGGAFEVSLHDVNDETSLSSPDIWSLYEDRSGLIWIGTSAGGLNQLNPSTNRFHSLRSIPFEKNSLRSSHVWSIKEDTKRQIWMTTLAGLERYDPASGAFALFQPAPSDEAKSQMQTLSIDGKNRIWAGSVDGHLYRFDGAFRNIPRGGKDTFSAGRVWHVNAGLGNRVWVATIEGVFAVDPESCEVVETIAASAEVPMGFAPVSSSLLDSDGTLWFGGGGAGLLRHVPGKGISQILSHDPDNPESLSNNLVRTLYESPDGALWLGTHNGLNRISREDRRAGRNHFRLYTDRDGLPDNTVYGILPEGDGRHLWLSTNNGISRFDPVEGTFRNFDVHDGLVANESNGGSAMVASDGKLYFGSVGGVTWFDPRTLSYNRAVPSARITRVDRHDGSPARVASEYRFDHGRMALSIDFAATDYHQPSKNRFRYRLAGRQGGDWVEADRPSVELAMLPSGDYRFEVLASNNDGVWSQSPATLEIHVDPPWWLSRIAWLSYASLLLIAGYSYHRHQRGKLLREREFSEQVGKERSLAEANHQLALHYAQIDQLTRLPNRTTLLDALGRAMHESRGGGRETALFAINLDRFQQINDTLGHAVGDGVLQLIAARVAQALCEGDLLARIGSDEFAVIAKVRDEGFVDGFSARLHAAISAPTDLRDPPLTITAGIGVATYADGSETPADLLSAAEMAMRVAKRDDAAATRRYQAGMRESAKEKLALEARMRRALAAGEFSAHYQPIVEAGSGALAGMEALIRWFPPGEKPIYPDRFIPLAEECGLVVELGTFMLRTACRQIAAFRALGASGITVAVNVSMRQLRAGTLVAVLRSALEEANAPPEMLKLELTESAVMESVHDTAEQLRDIRALGVKIAIDDFGTGFSSLGYLKLLPVNEMKIDRSFVVDIAVSEQSRKIVSSIVRLAHELKLTTVAEGVEDEASLRVLRELGCDLVQGYYFARPMPASDLIGKGWLGAPALSRKSAT